jgi:hypothetical protein
MFFLIRRILTVSPETRSLVSASVKMIDRHVKGPIRKYFELDASPLLWRTSRSPP